MFSERSTATSSSMCREIFVGDDGAVDRQDERLFAKLRNVLQDAPQVSQFHDRHLPTRTARSTRQCQAIGWRLRVAFPDISLPAPCGPGTSAPDGVTVIVECSPKASAINHLMFATWC